MKKVAARRAGDEARRFIAPGEHCALVEHWRREFEENLARHEEE